MKYGTEQVDYLGHEKLTYGHNKTNFGMEQGDFLVQENSMLSHMRQILELNEMFFWDKRSWFWIILRLVMGHNDVTFWDRRSWYWDITRWIMGQNKVIFWDWKIILVHIRRWSNGTFQDDNNIFHKMKNDLTTDTWQDNIWCPLNIILLCTSDAWTPIWERFALALARRKSIDSAPGTSVGGTTSWKRSVSGYTLKRQSLQCHQQ